MAQQYPLMRKQTAIWLIDNTTLTFEQIGDFCGLHVAEVQAISDGTVAGGMKGENPLSNEELTREEITRAEADPKARLVMNKTDRPQPKSRAKGPKYTPVSKRGDKPDAIMYLLKNHPEMTDAQIVKLVGTTKNTINNIRERTHANISNMKPRHPADLGICSYTEFEAMIEKARIKAEKEGRIAPRSDDAQDQDDDVFVAEEREEKDSAFGFDFSNFLGDTMSDTKKDGTDS